MEAAESPLEVLSRAAVMLQRNVLPPPSYDEARSISQHQQQQKQKILRKCKSSPNDTSSFSPSTTSYSSQTSNGSGKWKREKKYHKTSTASVCDSTSSDLKSTSRFLSNINHKCSNSNSGGSDGCASENEAEPLDMSKRTVAKERGEPPSYFQSILCSNYSRRQSGASTAIFSSSMDKSWSSTTTTTTTTPTTNTTLATVMTTTSSTLATAASPTTTTSSCNSSLSPTTSTDDKEAMCDQVINEHFRRSLGRDYLNVFSANKPTATNKEHEDDSPIETVQAPAQVHSDEVSQHKADSRCISPSPLSVDDHFAKALGDTWIKLQQQQQQQHRQQPQPKKSDNQKQVSCTSIQSTISHPVNES